jgi:hypothetical protein
VTATAAFCASRPRTTRPAAISLRKRLHVNPLITEPDTIEIDWGGAFPIDGPWSLPTSMRFTPEGKHTYWGRTEFSASFDSRRFDRATFAATCVVVDGDRFDLAVVPVAATTLRGDRGVKGGGLAIARYDARNSSAGVTAQWVAGTVDFGAGYGRQFLNRLTAHANWQWEKSTGTARQILIAEGVEYQMSDPFAIDVSAQHQNLWGGHVDHQIVVGLTFQTRRLHRH